MKTTRTLAAMFLLTIMTMVIPWSIFWMLVLEISIWKRVVELDPAGDLLFLSVYCAPALLLITVWYSYMRLLALIGKEKFMPLLGVVILLLWSPITIPMAIIVVEVIVCVALTKVMISKK